MENSPPQVRKVKKVVRKVPVPVPKHYDALDKMKVFDCALTTGLIADIFKLLYADKFIFCAGIQYNYNGTYWKADDDNLASLNSFVDTQFLRDLVAYAMYAKNADNEGGKKPKNKYDKFMTKMNTDLRNIRNRTCYVRDIARVLTNNTITWNINPYLFAFENAIFDLKTGLKVEPNPDDFINTTTGYNYDFSYDNTKIEKLNEILNPILPDNDVRDYLYTALSTCLCGIQIPDIFIFCGKGGNGKSVILRLLMKMVGNYGYEIPCKMLTEPLKMGGNPEAEGMNGKRVVLGSEPDANSRLCSSTLKALTGNPDLNVRKLNSNKCEIQLFMTLLIDCNKKPTLDNVLEADERRLGKSIIPFQSRFTTQDKINSLTEQNSGITPPNIYIGNSDYMTEEFRRSYKQAFFVIILSYFKRYLSEGFHNVPNIIKQEGAEYMAQSDDIYDWFSDWYQKDPSEMVYINDIHDEYLRFMRDVEMTKEEKRKYLSVKHFKQSIKDNLYLSFCYKERDTSWKEEQIKKPYLTGWKRRPPEDDKTVNPQTPQITQF